MNFVLNCATKNSATAAEQKYTYFIVDPVEALG